MAPINPDIFSNHNDLILRVWFNDGIHGHELWKTDGTTLGTRLCKDIFPGKESSNSGSYAENNGSLYLRAYDGVHGDELWKFDFSEL